MGPQDFKKCQEMKNLDGGLFFQNRVVGVAFCSGCIEKLHAQGIQR